MTKEQQKLIMMVEIATLKAIETLIANSSEELWDALCDILNKEYDTLAEEEVLEEFQRVADNAIFFARAIRREREASLTAFQKESEQKIDYIVGEQQFYGDYLCCKCHNILSGSCLYVSEKKDEEDGKEWRAFCRFCRDEIANYSPETLMATFKPSQEYL